MQRIAGRTGVISSGYTARLDWICGDPVDDEALPGDVCRFRESGSYFGFIASLIEIGLVVRAIVIELRSARLEGVARRQNSRTRCVFDHDAFCRITCSVEPICDYQRNRVADMHDAAERDRRPWRQKHRAAVP